MEPIDTTTQQNEKYRTHQEYFGLFPNGQEAFNALCKMPNPIVLADGRRLNITRWLVDGDEDILGGADHLPFLMEGFISLDPGDSPPEKSQLKEQKPGEREREKLLGKFTAPAKQSEPTSEKYGDRGEDLR